MNARLAVLSVVVILLALAATFVPEQRAYANVVTWPVQFDGVQLRYAPAPAAWPSDPAPIVWVDPHLRPYEPGVIDAIDTYIRETAVAGVASTGQPGRPAGVLAIAAPDYEAALRLYRQGEIEYARHPEAQGHEE